MANTPDVRNRKKRKRSSDNEGGDYNEADSGSSGGNDDSNSSSDSSNSNSSEAGEAWEAQSDNEETGDTSSNLCIFCGGDENSDPSDEYEEPLECKICNNTSHRQCARNHDGPGHLSADHDSDEGVKEWRCSTCHDLSFDPVAEETSTTTTPRLRLRLSENAPRSTPVIVEENGKDRRRLRRRNSDDEATSPPESSRPRRNARKLTANPSLRERFISETGLDGTDDGGITSARTSRRHRKIRLPDGTSMVSLKRTKHRLMIQMRFKPEKLAHALSNSKSVLNLFSEATARRSVRASVGLSTLNAITQTPNSINPFQSIPQTSYNHYTTEYYLSMNDDTAKPYGAILNDVDADTSKTLPLSNDKLRFDKARQEADEDQARREALLRTNALPTPRPSKRHDGSHLQMRASSHASMIKCIHFGEFEIDTWYAAPYPEEYSRNRILHICEFCLKYMNSEYVSWRHKLKCPHKHPPGDEIYRNGSISIFEVDGRKNPGYCQNLCLLAKLFLGSKTLYYDVEPFLFYIMTEYDDTGCHFVGYFSKEKRSSSQNNVSCILTLPIHQRKGYGNLLIDFSYLLTRRERKLGSPEKPLSDLGLVSYRNYWKLVLSYQLRDHQQDRKLSIAEISKKTGMTADDVICALEGLHALVRDPITKTYALRLDKTVLQAYIDSWERKGYVKLNPNALTWVPFVMGRQSHLQQPPPAIAPRDDEPPLEEGVLIDEQEGLTPVTTDLDTTKDMLGAETGHADDDVDMDGMDLDVESRPSSRHGGKQKKSKSPLRSKLTPPEEPINSTPKRLNVNIIRSGDEISTQKSAKGFVPTETKRAPIESGYIPPTRFQLVPPVPGSAPKKLPKFSRSPSNFPRISASPSAVRSQSNSDIRSIPKSQTNQLRRTRSNLFEEAREPHSMTIVRQSSRQSTRVSLAPRNYKEVASPDANSGQPATPAFTTGSCDTGDQQNESSGSSPSRANLPGTISRDHPVW